MNDTLKEALADDKNAEAFYAQKTVLVSECKDALILYQHGGTFEVTPSFITFIKAMMDEEYENLPVLDSNNDPVIIPDLRKFYNAMMDVYFQAMNSYVVKYQNLAKKRKVSTLIK